ncbi:MAG: Tad domain-containing protein [Acidobacteriaceae bacterium]|nr:Tad domain-containing protein [Acidobacteriaceae bacterium]
MRSLREITEENGQSLVLVAISMLVLMLFLGLAVDIGRVRFEKRRLQTAADAAALAASLEGRVCSGTANCLAMQTAARNALTENGYTSSTVTTGCTTPTATTLTLTLNNPPCLSSSDPNRGKTNYVEAVVSESITTYFARFAGFNSFHISARAEAGRGLGGPCLYALNPSAAGALNIVAGIGFVVNCGIVVESTSPAAVTCLIGALMYAPSIHVTGGTAGLLCLLNSRAQTHVAVPTPADPLAYLTPPASATDGCGYSSGDTYYGSQQPVTIITGLLQHIVFNPGVYCGGISITASVLSYITFNPGVYVLRNGHYTVLGIPGPDTSGLTMTVSLLSIIQGEGVMFYNQGNAGSFSITGFPPLIGLSSVTLSAPTSGPYGGILFFQAHGVTNTGTFLISLLEGSHMNGGIYMPDALVSWGVGVISGARSYNFIVADRIQFTANILSVINNDYSTLQNGSPLNGDTSFLVQ